MQAFRRGTSPLTPLRSGEGNACLAPAFAGVPPSLAGKGARGLGFARRQNPLQHTWEVAGYLVIGESQHSQAALAHDAVALHVVALLFLMYFSIHFHDEASAVAIEVDDEPIDHLLAAEVQAVELIAAQVVPQYALTKT